MKASRAWLAPRAERAENQSLVRLLIKAPPCLLQMLMILMTGKAASPAEPKQYY